MAKAVPAFSFPFANNSPGIYGDRDMATKFYRLVANAASPSFDPIEQISGTWFGVARVEDEAEQTRLEALGVAPITPEEYVAELKKKAPSPLSFPRQVLQSKGGLAQMAMEEAPVQSVRVESSDVVDIEAVATAKLVPKQKRSTTQP